MITDSHWKRLDSANREMARCLERLRKVRASGDPHEIKIAEMVYLQALQRVYDASVDAVAAMGRHSAQKTTRSL